MARGTSMNSLCATLAAVAVLFAGCAYDEFAQKGNSGWPIQTRILRERKHVEQTHDNAVRLSENAKIGMRVRRLTDGVFSTEVLLGKGGELVLQTRSTPYDDSVRADAGIVISVRADSTTVQVGLASVKSAAPIPTTKPFVVEIENNGRWTVVTVACTEVARIHTTVPSTEWVIASVPSGGWAHLLDPSFTPLN